MMVNVLGLNLANYDDHPGWNARLPLIVDAIVESNADIIGLSENRYNSNNFFNTIAAQFWATKYPNATPPPANQNDMGAQILALLQTCPGYEQGVIKTNLPQQPGGVSEGLSIISRVPVLNSGYVQLSSSGADANVRITQWAAIQLQSTTLYVYNTHFALDEADRVTNAQQTLTLIGANVNGLCCLVGDLNETPDDPALQILARAGLVDVWAVAQPGANGYTFPSSGPIKRIDYCWASPSMASNVSRIALAATQISGGVLYASDHLGLLTRFNIS